MAKQEKNSNWNSFPTVIGELKKGNRAQLYLVGGSEKYLIDKLIASMKKMWVSPGAESIDFYMKDAGNARLDLQEFQSLCGTPPFMSACRLTVILNSGLWSSDLAANEVENWKKALGSVPEFATVVFVEEKIDKRKKQLVEAVSASGMLVEVSLQDADTLQRWIKTSFSLQGISMSSECMDSLISRTDSSMRMIENETTKIVHYCKYTGTDRVDMDLLDRLCVPDVHASVFNMIDAIAEKNVGRAIEILNNLVTMKEPIPKIRLMFSRHVRHLICAKELGNARGIENTLKVKPFVARKLVNQVSHFTMEQLERQYFRCFDSDSDVKSGKMDDRTSMEVLLIGFAQP
ncbi:MAG: DNA polymerase III subunit delta [Clostridiales bacterium]|nr:DNA polymerase III subunit delta [Clostridiales bacterium]